MSPSTAMKSTVIAFLACLLVLSAQGHSISGSWRCKCSRNYINKLNLQLIKAAPIIHNPSMFCPRVEIIVKITANQEKCVNPESPLGIFIQNVMNKQQKTRPESTTAAASSATFHSTTML